MRRLTRSVNKPTTPSKLYLLLEKEISQHAEMRALDVQQEILWYLLTMMSSAQITGWTPSSKLLIGILTVLESQDPQLYQKIAKRTVTYFDLLLKLGYMNGASCEISDISQVTSPPVELPPLPQTMSGVVTKEKSISWKHVTCRSKRRKR